MEILGGSPAAVIDGEPCEAGREMKIQVTRRNLTFDVHEGVEVASGTDTRVACRRRQAGPWLWPDHPTPDDMKILR